MRHCLSLIAALLVSAFLAVTEASFQASAQEEGDENAEAIASESDEEIELTDEELGELLTRIDRFYIDQGMARISVDVDVYRDPSNRLNSQNVRTEDPSRIAGLSTIVSHFTYEYPEFYELAIMGYVLAGSDVPPDPTFFSQAVPLPGAPIFTHSLQERFTIRFEGTTEVEERPAYKIRYYAKDRDNEFFDYIVYYIDIDREVLLRAEGAFDNVWYKGIAEGNFYYREWKGKYLPEYGHGSVLFYPSRRFNIWGRWYRWDWKSPEDLEAEETERQNGADESGGEAVGTEEDSSNSSS